MVEAGSDDFGADLCDPLGGQRGSSYTFDITMAYLQVRLQWAPKPEWTTTEPVTAQTLGVTSNNRNARFLVTVPAGGRFTEAGDAVPIRVEVVADEWFRGPPLVGTVKVVKVKPTITLTAPKAVAVGTAVSAAVIAQTAPEPLQPTYAPAGNSLFNTAGDVLVTASFVGNDRFAAADPVTVTVKVAAKPVITWPPLPQVVVGTMADDKILCATVQPQGLALSWTPAPNSALNTVGDVTLTAIFDGNAVVPASDPVSATIKVIKDKPTIVWKPLPVLANSAPQQYTPAARAMTIHGTQAVVDMKYDPLPTAAVGAAGSMNVRAYFADTAIYEKNELTVPVKIVADRATLGREGMINGDGWIGPQSQTDKALLKKWDEDDSPTGLKKTAQKVMADIQGMTGEELIAYMDDLINPGGSGAIGTRTDDPPSKRFPNYIWELPNGMQVRYKPRGDGRPPVTNPPTPMFCVEGKTCVGPSRRDSDVAFKVTSAGNPGAYGPGQTFKPPGMTNPQLAESKEYMNAACSTTHLSCKLKEEQTITWANPPDITVGDTLATTLATVQAEDRTLLEFFDASDAPVTDATVPVAGPAQVLKVKGKASKRYLVSAAAVTVTLNVKKKTQTITWNPAQRQVQAGDPLGGTLMSAAAPGGTPICHIAGRNDPVTAETKLPAGIYTITARMGESPTYEAAPDLSIEVTVVRRPQTIAWQPPRTVIPAGSALAEVLNASVTPSGVTPVYEAVGETTQAVTGVTVLPPGAWQITATAPQTDLYTAADPIMVTFTVAKQPQTIAWRPARGELPVGSALGDFLNGSVSPGDRAPVYRIEGGIEVTANSVLRPAKYRIVANAVETPLLLAAEPVSHDITILPPAERR